MKKIINGKLYDTETAKEIGAYDNGLGASDFRHFRETLYCKKTGEFFLHGLGGAMTRYSENRADCITGGAAIIPFTEADAKKWVQENLDVETYVNLFGVVEE